MQPLVNSIRQLTKTQQLLIGGGFFAVLVALLTTLQMRAENTALSAIVALSVGVTIELLGFFIIRPLGRIVNMQAEQRFGDGELPPLPKLIVRFIVTGVIPFVVVLVPVAILMFVMRTFVSIDQFNALLERGELTFGPLQCAYLCLAAVLTHLLLSSRARSDAPYSMDQLAERRWPRF